MGMNTIHVLGLSNHAKTESVLRWSQNREEKQGLEDCCFMFLWAAGPLYRDPVILYVNGQFKFQGERNWHVKFIDTSGIQPTPASQPGLTWLVP